MKINKNIVPYCSKFIFFIIAAIVLVYIGIRIGTHSKIMENIPISSKELNIDYNRSYNYQRVLRGLPKIPEDWTNIHPLHYRVQTWENQDNCLPRYSQKVVVADKNAPISKEIDKYNISMKDDLTYQVAIEYNYSNGIYSCSASWIDSTGYAKDIRALNISQAIDTLESYGLKRLNY